MLYKDRKPEETVKIITDFFHQKKCQLKEIKKVQSEINTYSFTYELWYNNHCILTAYGKGISEILAKASGLSELYERFCAFPDICFNPIAYQAWLNLSNAKQNKKQLTLSEILNNQISKLNIQSYISDLNPDLTQQFLNAILGPVWYGDSYQTLDNQNQIYVNSISTTWLSGTNGFAAGNTIAEALVQGSSELYERYAIEQYLANNIEKYYAVDLKSLPNHIQQYINILQKQNFKVFIYDLSYSLNIPVCMLILINTEQHILYNHFGAHPIFTIAIERCFTETYQGLNSWTEMFTGREIVPYENLSIYEKRDIMASGGYDYEPIVNNLFNNTIYTNTYNHKIYAPEEITNNEILLKQIIKINQQNNIIFYYHNLSLCDNMAAVHIIANIPYGLCIQELTNNVIQENNGNKLYAQELQLFIQLTQWIQQLSTNKSAEILTQEFIQLANYLPLSSTKERDTFLRETISNLVYYDIINPYVAQPISQNKNMAIFFDFLAGNFIYHKLSNDWKFTQLFTPWRLYYLYCISQHKDIKFLNNILTQLGYDELNIDINNFTPSLFIQKSLVENLQIIYQDEKFTDFIKLFIK